MPRSCRSLMLVLLPGRARSGHGSCRRRSRSSRATSRWQLPGLPPRAAPLEFTMVGIHWQGGGQVWFRTAPSPAHLEPWRPARPEEDDLPDAGSDEGARPLGWHLGNPWWTGAARSIQYRVAGHVTRLRTFFVDIPVTAPDRARRDARPATSAAVHGDARCPAADHSTGRLERRRDHRPRRAVFRTQPPLFGRAPHRRDEQLLGRAVGGDRARDPALPRARNGWNDIGYNYLVDKYGRIFEGRGGGLIQNVIGAHAQGFNTGSVGVAVLGTYDSAASPPRRATRSSAYSPGDSTRAMSTRSRSVNFMSLRQRSLPRRRARPPAGGLGTPRHGLHELSWHGALRPAGRDRLERLAHRPSEALQPRGRRLRRRPRPLHRPPLVGAGLARAGQGLGGAVVAQGTGSGKAVDWTWNAGSVPIASYTYEISAGPDTRPAARRSRDRRPSRSRGSWSRRVSSPRTVTGAPSAPLSPSGSPGAQPSRSGS